MGDNKQDILRDEAVMLLMQVYVDQAVCSNEHWREATKQCINNLQGLNDPGIDRYWNDLAVTGGAEL